MRCGAVNAAGHFTAARAVRCGTALGRLQLFTFVESFRNARVENGRLRQLELKKVQAATHNGRMLCTLHAVSSVPRCSVHHGGKPCCM